jgi:hypothetical protein
MQLSLCSPRPPANAIETFVLLYQQISGLGNEEATNSFGERFVPMLPLDARRKIISSARA